MKTTLKKIWDIVSTVLVVLIVLCAVFLMGSRLIGYQCYTVLTGSMEPKYDVGDLIYVKEAYSKDIMGISDSAERNMAIQEKVNAVQAMIDKGTLAVGDPISFVLDENLTVATHRIVSIDEGNHKIYTQGDTNKTVDAPILYENVIGKVVFSIPKLGYVSNFIQNPPGMYITIGAGAVIIILVFLPDLIKKKEPEKSEE